MKPEKRRYWEQCSRCQGVRELFIDLNTGRYRVLYPAKCETKDICITETLNNANVKPRLSEQQFKNWLSELTSEPKQN